MARDGWQRLASGVAVGIGEIVAITAVVAALQHLIPVRDLAVLYVLAVLPIAAWWGLGLALVVAVLSALVFNVLFISPTVTVTWDDRDTVVVLVVAVATASVVSALAGGMRRRTREAEALARDVQAAQAELRRVADEQAALRRVAELVARDAPPAEVFAAVTEEIARLLPADLTVLGRYEPDGSVAGVGFWSASGERRPDPMRAPVGGRSVAARVFATGRAAHLDSDGAGSSVGAPITVEGRLWGVVIASSRSERPLPADTEGRLVGFTELVATAIANAENRAALTASRARIVATADSTRRRIERDLHDGAQQRLVSLALQLRGVQAAVPPGAGELAARLADVGTELTGVLDELREIARGIHPAVLAQGGLRPAVKALARRSAVPVRLDLRVDGRLPEPLEVATYYVVSEALTNAAKHAGASQVDVEVSHDGRRLHACVRDDGRGGAHFADGSGLTGLRDRIEALGGRLTLQATGPGTTVEVDLPLEPAAAVPG
jgi:signal transduction histidine kinase